MRLRENLFLDRLEGDHSVPDLRGAQAILLKRAEVLPESERLLLELTIKNGLTHRQLALMLSVPAGTITRRLRRLRNRLCDPMIVALLRPACPLPANYREIAILHMLHRKTVRALSIEHHLPRYQVKHMLEFVRGWHRGSLARARV